MHGGGYLSGFSNTYNQAALRYSQSDHHATVFSLDYRTAPKYRFPAALNDAIDGYRWLLQHGYQPQNIIIAGDSSGAGLSLVLTLYLRDHKLALPRALVLASPWTDLTASGSSYHTKVTSDPLFGSSTIKTAPKYPVPITYAGSHNLKDPYLSPAFGNFKGLPPMLIQTGSHELLLSDSTTVVKKRALLMFRLSLSNLVVCTIFSIFPPHKFQRLSALGKTLLPLLLSIHDRYAV
ncbi:alpha/beta hydrolase [Lacticaseibacillus rhamnosus]|nr:alpha/beta hydrolase [Lacticaseibacillus rhamnosus]